MIAIVIVLATLTAVSIEVRSRRRSGEPKKLGVVLASNRSEVGVHFGEVNGFGGERGT